MTFILNEIQNNDERCFCLLLLTNLDILKNSIRKYI